MRFSPFSVFSRSRSRSSPDTDGIMIKLTPTNKLKNRKGGKQKVDEPKIKYIIPVSLPKADSEGCATFISFVSSPDTQADELVKAIAFLDHNICHLDDKYKRFVLAVVNINWLNHGPELVSVFLGFILNLVSAHMMYLRPCLKLLVKKFIPDEEKEALCKEEEVQKKIDSDLGHIHTLLQSLSKIVPMMSEVLTTILAETFPYINRSVFQFEHYTRNLLTLSHYMPHMRMSIFELIVSHMLKLDVRAPRLDISTALCDDDDGEDSRDEDMFDMEEDNNEHSPPQDTSSLKVQDKSMTDKLADTLPHALALDVMMGLCFKYIKDTCYKNDKLDWEETKKLYRELLWLFDKYIFPTHESCHVQYLLFYICSFKEALSDGFIDYLLKKVMDPTAQCVYRETAACYIGSFVTRASYLPLSTSRQTVELLMRWIHTYLDQSGEVGLTADIEHHGAFYSVCQSAFYIFCFLHNDFMQSKKGQRWGESQNFQRVITSKLNPLRVCMPIVVKTFASATRMHQLAFCDTIIERNARYSLPVTSSKQGLKGRRRITLESYFPFDPYLLPGSGPAVVQLYREYQGSLPDVDHLENEDEDDFLPEEDEKMTHSADFGLMLSKSPAVDFLHYGVSPGFKHT